MSRPLSLPLRSLYAHPLLTSFFIPQHSLSLGSRAFRFSARRTWNFLPLRIHETQSLLAFKSHLKSHFFQLAYPIPSDPPFNAPWKKLSQVFRSWKKNYRPWNLCLRQQPSPFHMFLPSWKTMFREKLCPQCFLLRDIYGCTGTYTWRPKTRHNNVGNLLCAQLTRDLTAKFLVD